MPSMVRVHSNNHLQFFAHGRVRSSFETEPENKSKKA